MTIQQVKEHSLSPAQQDLIELIEDMQNDNMAINRPELDPKQKAVAVILEKRGFITIAKNGDITITDKSKEGKIMAAKKVVEKKMVKVDEKALKAVAKDLNDVLGLEPAIDLKAKDLLERVREEAASVGVDPKTGKISQKLVDGDKKELQPETWEFLEEHKMLEHLGAEEEEEDDAEEAEKPLKKADKKAAKAVAVKEEEEENEEEGKPAAKAGKPYKKAPVEKAPVGKASTKAPAEKKIEGNINYNKFGIRVDKTPGKFIALVMSSPGKYTVEEGLKHVDSPNLGPTVKYVYSIILEKVKTNGGEVTFDKNKKIIIK